MDRVYLSSKQKPVKQPATRSKRAVIQGSGRLEHIQLRAYEIYQERMRNNVPGEPISDWVKAEQEVNSLGTEVKRQG